LSKSKTAGNKSGHGCLRLLFLHVGSRHQFGISKVAFHWEGKERYLDMMQYGDEDHIYYMANNGQPDDGEGHQNSIGDGYAIIDGVRIPFSEREIIDGKLYMTMPTGFGLMPEELAEFKYPSKNRPHYIFTDDEGEINICITITPDKLEDESIEDAKKYLKNMILKVNPKSEIIRDFIVEGSTRTGYFDFISTAIDSDIYNLVFIFTLEGQFILGTFNCLHLDMARWKDVADQMAGSIRVI
jgi:hypothetical protein